VTAYRDTVATQEERLAFTAESPAAYLDEEPHEHPLLMAGRAVLERRGELEPLRERALAILEDGNEDPSAFRVTSRYVVAAAAAPRPSGVEASRAEGEGKEDRVEALWKRQTAAERSSCVRQVVRRAV
jgi:hypothetical protein